MWSSITLLLLPIILRIVLCIPSTKDEEPQGLVERDLEDIPVCTGNLPHSLRSGQPFSTNQELCVESAAEEISPSLLCRCTLAGMVECFSVRHYHRPPPLFIRRRRYQRHCKQNCRCPDGPDLERSRRPGILGTLADSIANPNIGQISSGSLNVDPVLGSFGGSLHGGNVVAVADTVYPSALDPQAEDSSCIGQTCSSFANCSCSESVACAWRAVSAGLFFALGECVKMSNTATISGVGFYQGSHGGRRRRRKRDVIPTSERPSHPHLYPHPPPPLQDQIQPFASRGPLVPTYTQPCQCNATHSDLLCCPILPGSVLWQDEWGWGIGEQEEKEEDGDDERESKKEILLLEGRA